MLDKDGKPFLQGWAVVDNPTDDDWNKVGMALISGRPISFQMDLYQPLYVPRPTVELELFQSLRPVAYDGGDRQMDAKPAEVAAWQRLGSDEPPEWPVAERIDGGEGKLGRHGPEHSARVRRWRPRWTSRNSPSSWPKS